MIIFKVFKSKINLLGLFLALIGLISDPAFSVYMKDVIPPEFLSKIMSFSGLILMILRTFFNTTNINILKKE